MGLLGVIRRKNPEFVLYTDGSSIVKGGVREAVWSATMDNVKVTGTLDLRKAL